MEQSIIRTNDFLPAILQTGGVRLQTRFLEFFTANTPNANTRAAYGRAAASFLRWCDRRGIVDVNAIQPTHIAAFLEEVGRTRSKPTVKQYLSCLRMLFRYLHLGQVVSSNPALAVRGPRYSVDRGSTPHLSAEEARLLLESIDTASMVGQRDRALIATMVYSFARVTAAVTLTVGDYHFRNKRRWLRLQEKNGTVLDVPCHHTLEKIMDEYIERSGIRLERALPLFRAAVAGSDVLTADPMDRMAVYRVVRRRAKAAGIQGEISPHAFRVTGISVYLENGGKLELAQRLAGHKCVRTTRLYDRRTNQLSPDEVEKIVL